MAPEARDLHNLADEYHVVLDSTQRSSLDSLPPLTEGPVGSGAVLIALEAKAAMTAHSKARPRLYDELNSSQLTVHGASRQALAIGLVMVNVSETFISPDLNKGPQRSVVSKHKQPRATATVIEKIREIPRRTNPAHHGFDGLGVVVVSATNDGSTPVTLIRTAPAPQTGDILHYDSMVTRMANEYDTTFTAI